MRFTGRTAVAVLSAAAAMAVGTGSAAAGTISPGGSLTGASTAPVFVRIPALANTTCSLSFSGTLATSYALPLPAAAGSLTSFGASSCLGGITLTATSTPNALSLTALTGTLPSPTGGTVTATGVTVLVTLGAIRCSATGDIPLTLVNGSTTATSAGASLAGGCGGITIGAGSYSLSAAQTIA